MSDTTAIRIVGMTLTNSHGSTRRKVVAFFDCTLADMVTLCGMALIRGGNALSIATPRFEADHRKRVELTSTALRDEIRRQAIAAYIKLGGEDVPAWALVPGGDKHEQAAA